MTGFGALAQLVERLLCKQDVNGSNPLGSTISSHLGKSSRGKNKNSSDCFGDLTALYDIVKEGRPRSWKRLLS